MNWLAAGLLLAILLVLLTGFAFTWERFRSLNKAVQHLQSNLWHTHMLEELLPKGVLYPAPYGWSAFPDALSTLANIVLSRKPEVVVELGSGMSTLVIAAALKRNGRGRLVSIDHDLCYADQTRKYLDEAGLSEWVDLRIAEVKVQDLGGEQRPWYDAARLSDLKNVGLLFVDGPPGPIAPNVREPALDFFWPRLSSDAAVVLDDADRKGERRFVQRWLSGRGNVECQYLPLAKGCFILRNRASE